MYTFLKAILFLLILNLLATVNGSKIGELDVIDYETEISANEQEFFKNKHIILVFFNEKSDSKEENYTQFNEFKVLLDELNESTSQQQIKIYAVQNQKYANKFGILKYPELVYYRNGNFVKLKGAAANDAASMFKWIEDTVEKKTHQLSDSSFEHDTQSTTGATTGDWLVLFHNKDCKTKILIESNWEMTSLKLENQVNLAYVDLDANSGLQERFHVYNSPSVIFFRQGLLYRYELGKYDIDSLVSFTTNGFYKNVKSEKVPREMLFFDRVTDDIVNYLRGMDKSKVYGIFAVAGFICVLVWIWTYKKFQRKNANQTLEDSIEKGKKQF